MFRKWFLGILALLIVIGLLFWISSKNLIRSSLENQILGAIKDATGLNARLGEIDISLIPPSVVLRDLEIPDQNKSKTPSLLSIKETRLLFSPLSFFTKLFVINRVEIHQPTFFLERRADQSSPFDQILKRFLEGGERGKSPTVPDINLKKLIIDQGALIYQQDGFSASFPNINVEILSSLILKRVTIAFQIEDPEVEWKGTRMAFLQIVGEGLWTSQGLTIEQLRFSQGESRLAISGSIDQFNPPIIDLDVETDLHSADFPEALFSVVPVTGRLQWSGDIQGPLTALGGTAKISLNPLQYRHQEMKPLTAQFTYEMTGESLSLKDIQGTVFGGDYSGEFSIPISGDSMPVRSRMEFTNVDPFPLLAEFTGGFEGFHKPISGEISFDGHGASLSSLEGNASVKVVSSQTVKENIKKGQFLRGLVSVSRRVDLDFSVKEKDLSITVFHVETPHSTLSLSGTINRNKAYVLAYQAFPSELGEFLPFFGIKELRGKAEISGVLVGTIDAPFSQSLIKVENATYKRRPVGSLVSHLLLQNDLLKISSFTLVQGNEQYRIGGTVSLPPAKSWGKADTPTPIFDLSLEIDQGIPQNVVALFFRELPIEGAADGHFTLNGTPENFKLKGSLEVGSGSAYGQSFDEGFCTLIVERSGVIFEEAAFRRNDSLLTGKGSIAFKKSFSVEVSSEGVAFEDIDWMTRKLPDMEGTFAGLLVGKGPFRDPRITLNAGMTRIVFKGQDFGQGRLEALLEGRTFSVNSSFGENAFRVKSQMELRSPFPYEVEVFIQEARMDPFIAPVQPTLFQSIQLTSTGRVFGTGTLKKVNEISLTASLSDVRLDFGAREARNDGEINLEYKEGVLKVNAFQLKGEDTILAVFGSLKPKISYDLFIRGETDLNVLQMFTREITHTKGKAYLALRIFDEWNDPKIRGGMTSQGGALRSETLSQTILLRNLGLLFNEKQVLLETLEGQMGGGNIRGSGKVDIRNFTTETFGLILELEDVRFRIPEGLSSLVDGTILFQGDQEDRNIKGELIIQRAAYTKRVEWKSWVTEVITGRSPGQRSSIPLVGNTRLNIHIVGQENILVENNLASFPLTVDLYVRGTLNFPVILGRIETGEGTFFFRKNKFQIERASIDFINPDRTDPILDVKATTRVRDYEIELTLTGHANALNLFLTSNPPLSETDVLSLLVVGKTSEEVALQQTGIGTTEFVSIATGDVQEILEQQIEEITGFDRIQVDPYYGGTRAAGGPRLTVSKKLLNDDLVVTYSVSLDPSEEQTVLLEYLLRKNILLEGRRDELGRLGGNIKFRFEFR